MPIAPPPQLKAGLFARGSGTIKTPKLTATGAPPPKGPSGTRIEHRIGIQAPAEVIWEIIRDLSLWGDWNPMYPHAAGEIRIGATLDVTVAMEGVEPMTLSPVVLDWVPNEQLHWKVAAFGGLVKSTRFIEIESLAEASCVVANGEYIGGLMGGSAVRRVGRAAYRGFIAMNEALKARAEAKWQAGKG